MDQYCESCRRSFPAERANCPTCGRAAVRREVAVNGRAAAKVPVPQPVPHESSAADAVQPTPSSAEIDLGGPVGKSPSGDPPSGASMVGWAALLRAREAASKAQEMDAVEFDPVPASSLPLEQLPGMRPPVGTAADGGNRSSMRSLVVGLLLGVAVCVGLWSVGLEPPQALRRLLDQWLGRTPPAVQQPNLTPEVQPEE